MVLWFRLAKRTMKHDARSYRERDVNAARFFFALFTQCFGYDRYLLFYLNVELKIIVRHIHPRSLRFEYEIYIFVENFRSGSGCAWVA